MQIAGISSVYPEYTKIYGPYSSGADGRARLVLYNPVEGTKTTKLLARVVLECHLGRQLTAQETVDHIDGNKLNDSVENLRILSRAENARRSAIGNTNALGFKQKESSKQSGSKNGGAKLTDSQVLEIRLEFANNKRVSYYCEKYGLTRKTVENLLSGKSYVKSKGPTYRFTVGRKKVSASVAKLVETQGA